MNRPTYRAQARRIDEWWAIVVDGPDLSEAHTQARRLDKVEDMARDLIATHLDIAPDTFDVEVTPCPTPSAP